MKKLIAFILILATVCCMVQLPVNAAQTVKVPLEGYYDESLGDYRQYGTATITGVLGTTTWGAQTAYIIDENSTVTIDCELGFLVVQDKTKKEYDDGYEVASAFNNPKNKDCTINCTVDGFSVKPGATLKFHTPKEFLCVNMSLGREKGFYETTSFMLQVKGKNEAPKAIFTNSSVYVNNKKVSFKAYNIGGNNYFKLRDLAYAFSGTEKQFEVVWDGKVNLISGQPYTAVGGELIVGDGSNRPYVASTNEIFVDGVPVDFKAYNIDGNNYFKLRDVCKYFDIGCIFDADLNRIRLDTSIPYTE